MISKNYIKLIHSLERKKNRDEQGKFVLEGEKMLLEILNWKSDYLIHLFYTEDFKSSISNFDESKCTEITEKELKTISRLQTPNKALAIFQKWEASDVKSNFYLALDGVQDPGNMGTIMRLADWFGIPEIICSKDTVDCFNPKVVQATMGAIFRVQVRYVDLEEYLPKLNLTIYGALLEGENVYQMNLSPKGVLVLGNEGKGISEAIQKIIDKPISIPRFGEAESLNVSTAGAILISEFFRSTL
jgi:TrmH family RNA methyltransferase